ncbi:TPA: hypothetical protein KLA35_001496, partial [Campylobacter jejuni]|nr:hypothetical protein [Campylobacter jejuni]
SNIKHCIDLKIKNDEKNEKELKKDKIREIKKQLAESAKKENIKESYFKFLELLKNSLEEL